MQKNNKVLQLILKIKNNCIFFVNSSFLIGKTNEPSTYVLRRKIENWEKIIVNIFC